MNSENAERIVKAAMDLAAESGWTNLTMPEIAGRAGVSLAEVYQTAPSKHALLCRLSDKVNRTVLDGARPSNDETPRERLFEVIMARLDALGPYKPALIALKRDMARDPAAALTVASLIPPAMAWMLEAANIPATGLDQPLRVLGLTDLYRKLLRTWMADDTEDGGATMAELDRLLKKAEGWARTLGLDR